MKRMLSLLLTILLISTVAFASGIPQFNSDLFLRAKQALTCLSTGEYERLVTLLPFSDIAPSASEWQEFVEGNFRDFPDVIQIDYSVAYWTGNVWKLAVPVCEPIDDNVETFILTSPDGAVFSGYGYSTWAEVRGEYIFASYVTWNKEYVESNLLVTTD